jgi:hypothetical protein
MAATMEGEGKMRFMVIVKANADSEAGRLPDSDAFAEMGKFNEELAQAGVLLAADGLQPTAKGARIRFSGGKATVIDGPFAETKELVAGFWIVRGDSKEEVVERFKRAPFDGDAEIELRQIFELEDFAPLLDPSVRQNIERLQAQIGERT